MANPLPPSEQQALLWPIQAKGAVVRLQPLNDPTISQYYPNSMEQGRFLESSIADANNWMLQKTQLLRAYITSYNHMNSLAVDGQLSLTSGRGARYVGDSISILQTAGQLQQELQQLVQAIQKNITMLLSIEHSMLALVQTVLDSIANLLNNICNWGLPALPSIPNLFPEMLWNWNGFLFSPLALFAALKSDINFNFNFTFGQCSLGPTATPSTFVGNPITLTNNSGLTFGSGTYFVPPFNGSIATGDLTDPSFIAQMQANTTDPVFNPTFNPLQNMWGAMPDPHYIVSNWQPSNTLDNYIVSIVPALRGNTVFVGDPDYSNPLYALRDLQLRKDLISFVNLGNIVASNFDPLLTAAWLIYLSLDRAGRGGVWIPNFQTAYTNYIEPSLSAVTSLAVPWNDVLGLINYIWMSTWNTTTTYAVNDIVTYSGTTWLAIAANTDVVPGSDSTMWEVAPPNVVYANAPQIPLLQTFASLTPNELNHLLWQLSYVEASLLGYTRNPQWDSYQDNSYLHGATGSDLDYQSTAISTSITNVTLGSTTAEFPVPITFPTSFQQNMNIVIDFASADIQTDVTYLSPRLNARYTYDQFAQAKQVDRFSQFWRDFANNLAIFLAQDPYLVQFAATYPEILNGAINPLGDPSAYNSLLQDVASRSRTWTPGTPLLTIPIQPITVPPSSFSPDINDNGWINDMDFNPVAFLARPDIQALPIPTQIAMLRTNLSYAGINVWKNNMQTSIANAISTANALLQATQQVGFHVSVYTTITPVVTPGSPAQVNFDLLQLPQDFDNTGNVTTLLPGLFTIQEAGTYNGIGTFVWSVPAAGTFTITITQNGTAIATASSTVTTGPYPATTTTNITFNQPFVSGDIVKVFASTNLVSGTADIEPTSTFSMLLSSVSSSSGGNTPSGQGVTRNYLLDNPLPSWVTQPVPTLTAISIDSNGKATPLDPSVPTIIGISITSNVLTVTTTGHHFSANDLVTFSGVNTTSFLNGQTVTVLSSGLTPTVFTANFTNANYTDNSPFISTSVANASAGSTVYTGAITGGAGNAYAGFIFVVSGFTNLSNNGTFACTASSATTLTLSNANGVAETHAAQAGIFDGSVLYAINSSGAVLAPNPDGVTLTSGSAGQQVTVTAYYGEQYVLAAITAADQIVVGGLLYVGLGGRLTQDYTSLVTGVGWIICIGRVSAYDTGTHTMSFIYEPHVPTRFSSLI